MIGVLLSLAGIFAELSLLAFGGGNTTLPEMQRQVVEVHHWMTASDFSALFSLAQAAPGPNMMVVTLIGWRVAGLAGAAVTTVAMFGPSSVLSALTLTVWQRFHHTTWRRVVQAGIVPVTVGLVAASAALIAVTSDTSWSLAVLTACVAVILVTTRVHPLWLLAAGGVLGLVQGLLA